MVPPSRVASCLERVVMRYCNSADSAIESAPPIYPLRPMVLEMKSQLRQGP